MLAKGSSDNGSWILKRCKMLVVFSGTRHTQWREAMHSVKGQMGYKMKM